MFGDEVRAHRLRLGMTQERLAEVSGVGLRTIGNIETGQIAVPRPSTVRLLADALGLDGPRRDRFHESALLAGAGRADGTGTMPTLPRQLPASPPMFTGRVREIADLDNVHDSSTVVITAIDGMAGVGKTKS